MDEKQIAKHWYMKGVKDAETTERQEVELSQTLKDFDTHFELQYKSQKSAIPIFRKCFKCKPMEYYESGIRYLKCRICGSPM